MSSYSVMATVSPLRLEIFLPCSFRIIGRWAYSGRVAPSAFKMLICLGVLFTWSSPRITWVMPMSMSSTTTQKL